MKKQIIILALFLVSGISLLRAQPVTGLTPADMKSVKYEDISFSFTRNGNNLVVSANELVNDMAGYIRITFSGNTRKEFEQFAGVVSLGKLQLKLMDETTGKLTELMPDENGDFRLVITFPESHVYKFILNGKVIGTGYKPK